MGELRSTQQRAPARPVRTDCSHYCLLHAPRRVGAHPPDINPWWCRLSPRRAQSATIHTPCTIPNQIPPYLHLQRVGPCQGTTTCYLLSFSTSSTLIANFVYVRDLQPHGSRCQFAHCTLMLHSLSPVYALGSDYLERVAELSTLKLKELCGYPSYGLKQY